MHKARFNFKLKWTFLCHVNVDCIVHKYIYWKKKPFSSYLLTLQQCRLIVKNSIMYADLCKCTHFCSESLSHFGNGTHSGKHDGRYKGFLHETNLETRRPFSGGSTAGLPTGPGVHKRIGLNKSGGGRPGGRGKWTNLNMSRSPWTDRQTDRTENITFPKTTMRVVKREKKTQTQLCRCPSKPKLSWFQTTRSPRQFPWHRNC